REVGELVDDRVRPGVDDQLREPVGVVRIAEQGLGAEAGQDGRPVRGAGQRADPVPGVDQPAYDPATDHAGPARDEDMASFRGHAVVPSVSPDSAPEAAVVPRSPNHPTTPPTTSRAAQIIIASRNPSVIATGLS